MSEQPLVNSSPESTEVNSAAPSIEASSELALNDPQFLDYVDLESDCSGIFDNLDTETAKQIIRKLQS
ncbi:MAG: hypothetical protein WCA35_31805 [Kovacikia sp.]